MVGGPDGGWLGPLIGMVKPLLLSPLRQPKFVTFMAKPNKEDLTILRELMAAGKVTPVIDRRYRLK